MKTILTAMGLISVACALTGCPKQLAIQAIILADDNGALKSPVTLAQIDQWVSAANSTYSGINYEFTFDHADVEQVNSTTLNRVPFVPEGWKPDPEHGIYFNAQSIYDMFANSLAAGYPDKIVVLFRGDGGGGWSWGPPFVQYISMPGYTNTCISKPTPGWCNPNDTLFAHEAGHYLGLAHTFTSDKRPCNETTPGNSDGDTTGQRADDAADDVTDTNPDPDAHCAPTASLNCAGGSVVVNGFTFNPPWTNIMSYHDCLPETISLNQHQAINLTLQHPLRSPIPQ